MCWKSKVTPSSGVLTKSRVGAIRVRSNNMQTGCSEEDFFAVVAIKAS
jgi:hypothetical protein